MSYPPNQPPYNQPQQPGQPPQPQPGQPYGYPPQQPYQQPGQSPQPQPGQPYGYPPQQPYQQPSQPMQQSYGYAVPAPKVKTGPNIMYALGLLGALLLIVCSFLPWLVSKEFDISITGMGSISSGGLRTQADAATDGVLTLSLGVITIVLAALGLWLNKKGFAIGLIVFGVISLLLMIFEVSNTGSLAGLYERGIGIWLGLIGAILVLAGGIVPLFVRPKKTV